MFYLTTVRIVCVCLREGECNFILGYWWYDSDRGRRSVQNNPVSVSNFTTEILQGIAWDKSRTFVVRELRLTA